MTWKDELVSVGIGSLCLAGVAMVVWWQPMVAFWIWFACMSIGLSWLLGVVLRDLVTGRL